MFVSCDKCGYDSDDRDSAQELADKVKEDGGQMEKKLGGWEIKCPQGHSGSSIHMD